MSRFVSEQFVNGRSVLFQSALAIRASRARRSCLTARMRVTTGKISRTTRQSAPRLRRMATVNQLRPNRRQILTLSPPLALLVLNQTAQRLPLIKPPKRKRKWIPGLSECSVTDIVEVVLQRMST